MRISNYFSRMLENLKNQNMFEKFQHIFNSIGKKPKIIFIHQTALIYFLNTHSIIYFEKTTKTITLK